MGTGRGDAACGFLNERHLKRLKAAALVLNVKVFERLDRPTDEIAVDLNLLLPESQCGRSNLCVHVFSSLLMVGSPALAAHAHLE
jgi:hypothetical protein